MKADTVNCIDLKSAAEILGVHEATIRRYINNNTRGFKDQCVRQIEPETKIWILKDKLLEWFENL